MSGAGFQPRSIVRRAPLLSSCAVAAALVAGGYGTPVRAQVAPTPNPSYLATGISTDATITVGTGATPSTIISLNQPTAIIDWTPTDNATNTSGNINFQAGGTATFFSDFSGFTVLNRVVPATGPGGFIRAIEFNGTTTTSSANGSVWFYSPGGIMAGPTAVFDVGSLILTANDIDTTGGLFGTGGEIRFRGSAGSRSAVTIQPGADLRATSEGSYIALVAPRIDQGGTVTVNGSAAYVAAESADITINSGLFNFTVTSGSTVDSGGETTLRHTGTTTGPAPGSTADPHAIYMVAIPKNDAVTMLISGTGTLGYASSASVENGVVILSAGANITSSANGLGGADVAATAGPAPGIGASISITGGNVTSRLTGVAVTDAIAGGSIAFADDLELAAGRTASVVANAGQTITVGGNLGLTSLGLSPFGVPTPGEASLRALGGGLVSISGLALVNASSNSFVGDALGGTAAIEVNGSSMTIGAGAFVNASAQGASSANGGSAQGGTASVSVTNGSLDLGGGLSIDATGQGGNGEPGGAGTGGTASLTTDNGSVTITDLFFPASIQIDAGGQGGSGNSFSGGGDGGAGTGGTALLTATNGGAINSSLIALDSSGSGGSGKFEFGYGTAGAGGNGSGGLSSATFANTTVTSNGLFVQSQGISGGGGFSNSGAGGDSGSATGGTATASVNGAAVTFSQAVAIDASARGDGESEGGGGSSANSVGGIGGSSTGGTARITVTAGSLDTASIDILSNAEATDGGNGTVRAAASGAATGGTSELLVQGGTLTAGVMTASAVADAGEDETADRGGDARGGTARLAVSGGSAAFSGSALVDASAGSDEEEESTGDAFGGTAAILQQNGATLSFASDFSILAQAAAGTNVTQVGGASTGGDASLTVEGSSLAIGDSGLTLSATAYGADANIMGGAATGGSATITVTNGDLTFSTPLSFAADGFGGDGQNGGAGTGGTVGLIANGGSIDVPANLSMSALGRGGRSDVGGDAGIGRGGIVSIFSGGSSPLASILRGSIALQNVTLDARGVGGAANEFGYGATGGGDGGAAFGGDVSIEAQNGEILFDIESTVSLLASGTGGASFDGGDSGDGNGGTANILAAAGDGGDGFIDLPLLQIDVSGTGGNPFETGYGIPSGANGGTGTGGEATVLAAAGELSIDSLLIDAAGNGARGDDGNGSGGGNGGDGTGGTILLGTTGGTLTLSGVDLSARGQGGSGGDGDDGENGGAGGDATGGSITIRAENQSLDLFGLFADVTANGGDGGLGGGDSEVDGGDGGNGGSATGGEFKAQVAGIDGVLGLGSLFISNDSTGGRGGDGASGPVGGAGGTGGSATGGLFEVSSELGSATLFSGEGVGVAFVANAFGGNGGIGGDGSDVGDTGGAGGDGGNGTGGIARIAVNGGAIESSFTEMQAQGNAGQAGDGGIGAGTPFIPGNPDLGIPDTLAGPVTFAARGDDGQGIGGTATIVVQDNSDTGEAGSATLGDVVIDTTGFGPGFDGPGFPDIAGRIEIYDQGSDELGGLTMSSLTATSAGFAPTSDQAFDLFSASRRIVIDNDATVTVGGPAYFRASGTGGVDIGGALDVDSNFFVFVEHDSQPATFVNTISANSIDIRASSDVRAFADSMITATNGIDILSEFGSVEVNIANAGAHIDLEAPGDVTANQLSAGADIEIDAGYDPFALDDDNIVAGTGGVNLGSVVTSGGEIDVESVGAVEGGDLSAGHELTITSLTGGVTLASAEAGTLDVPATPDNRRSIGIAALGDVEIMGDARAAIDIGIASVTGSIDLGALDAGSNIVLLAADAVNVGPVDASGLFYIANASMLSALGTGPDDYDASNLIGVTPVGTGGSVTLSGAVNAGPIVVTSGQAISFTSLASSSAVQLTAGTTVTGSDIAADADVLVEAAGDISVDTISSGGAVDLASSGGTVAVSSDLAAAGSVNAIGTNVTLNALGDLALTSAIATTGDLDVRVAGDLVVTSAFAADNMLLAAGFPFDSDGPGYLLDGDATINGTVSAGNFLHIDGGGDVTITGAGRVRSDGNIAIHSGDDIFIQAGAQVGLGWINPTIDLDSNTVTNLAVGGPADDVSIYAGLLRFGSANLPTNGASTINVDGSVTGLSIELASEDIAVGSAALIGSEQTSSLFFDNTGSAPSLIGGSGAGTGYALSNAEFARAQAEQIGIFGSTDVTIGDLDIAGSLTGTPPQGGRINLLGDNAALFIGTQGNVRINGDVALTSAGANDELAINAGNRIDVVTPDGSILISGPQGALAGRLLLSADQILVASAQAAQDIAATGLTTDAIDERLGTNDGPSKPEGYLQAGALEFSVENALYIQNSGGPGLGSMARAGFTAGSGGVRIDTGESSDARIIINGRLANSDGGFTGGADLIPLLTINGSQSPTGGFDLRSTANGCLIVGTSCRFDMPPATVPPVQDVIEEIMNQASDKTSNDGTAVVQLLNLPLIQLVDLSGLGFLPLIDEPVTGAGNDDLWMNGPSE